MKERNAYTCFIQMAMACLVIAGFIAAGPALAGPGLKQITPSVYAYTGSLDDSAANSFGANAGIVVGQDAVLVVDTLVSDEKARDFIRDIRAVTAKPVRYVVNTHCHVDHSWGNGAFAEMGAAIISHARARDIMQRVHQKILDKADVYLGLNREQLAGTRIVLPQLTFSEQMTVDLGGLEVVVRTEGPSHSPGSVFVHIPDQKVLFAGDILFTDYYANLGSSDIPGWITSLDHLAGLEIEHIIPGHGPLSGKNDLAAMRDYLLVFDAKAKELSAGSTDVQKVAMALKASIPEKEKGERLIQSSLRKYMRKK